MSTVREREVALMIADLCGYTALTETHGALHASEVVLRFQALAREALEPGVALINAIGDDVLCAGAETVAVVRSALRLRERTQREPDFPGIRTGLHRGRIVERDGQVFGAPINLAARLAAFARGGQILCSESVARAAGALEGIAIEPQGAQRFRNVAYPVETFEIRRAAERRARNSVDPVCRMQVAAERAVATIAHQGTIYRFCSLDCARIFANAPDVYVRSSTAVDHG